MRSTAIFTGLRKASADIVNTFAAQLLRVESPPKRPSGSDGYRRCTNRRTHKVSALAFAAGSPWLLQSYVWQDYDLCPAFPALNKFLSFWLETLEGPLHSVTVAHARLIKPAEIRAIDVVLADGAGRARNLARQTMGAVKDVVGFVRSS